MGKRSAFARRALDYYPTPRSAIVPLVPHLPEAATYVEPCGGDGRLVEGLADLWPGGRCILASDLEPRAPWIASAGLFDVAAYLDRAPDLIVTNPPWPAPGQGGEPVISIARALAAIAPTWLLLSADLAHNVYFPALGPCRWIVSVGRVSWEGNGQAGKDNAAWYCFDRTRPSPTWPAFVPRAPKQHKTPEV